MAHRTAPSAGRVAHAWAATGVDLKTEEGRAFYQERLALLGKVGFLLSAVFFVLLVIAGPAVFAERSRAQGGVALQLANHLVFLATWILCRRGRLPLAILKASDAGLPIVVCLNTAAQLMRWPGDVPGQEWAAARTVHARREAG